MIRFLALSLLSVVACAPCAAAQTAFTPPHITPNATIYIETMGGFETYLAAAILKKKVPLVIVDDAEHADYLLSGTSHVEKASWAKAILVSPSPSAGASISVKKAKSGELVFAYSVDKFNAARASQSTAEACAKHLKQAIEKH